MNINYSIFSYVYFLFLDKVLPSTEASSIMLVFILKFFEQREIKTCAACTDQVEHSVGMSCEFGHLS